MPKIDLAPKIKLPVPRSDRVIAWLITIVVIVGLPLLAYTYPHPLGPSITVVAGWVAGCLFGVVGAWEKRP